MLTFEWKSLLKRAIAFVLTVSLVLSSTADLIPVFSRAFAEETVASQPEEAETPSAENADGEDQPAFMDVELSAMVQQALSVNVSAASEIQESAPQETPAAEELEQEEPAPVETVEEAPASVEEADEPVAAANEEEAPAPVEEEKEESAPVEVTEEPVSAENEEETPAPVEEEKEEAALVEVTEEPASAEYEKEVSAPVEEEKEEPAPVEEAEAPTFAENEEETPVPVEEEKEEAAPVEVTEEPASAENGEEVPAPVEEEKEEPAPVEEAEEPVSAENEEDTLAPVEEEKAEPAPVEATAEPASADSEEEALVPDEEEKEESAPAEEVEEAASAENEEEAPALVEEEKEESAPVEATEEPASAENEEETPAPDEEEKEESAPAVEAEDPAPAEAEEESASAAAQEDAAPVMMRSMNVSMPTLSQNAPAAETDGEGKAISGQDTETDDLNSASTLSVADHAAPVQGGSLLAATPNSTENGTEESEEAAEPSQSETKEENKTTALQQLIKEKIGALTKLTGIVQIVLGKNTTYEGDVEIKKTEEQTAEEDFQLELVAEDALDENGEAIEEGGSGKTIVNGDLKISGINVLMRGVLMALGKKVTVSEAVLTYEGTNETDALEVDLAKDGSALISTYGGEDNITVNLYDGARNAEIDTGDDADKLNITALDGTVQADTGDGDDTVEMNLQSGVGAVTVQTGEGADTVDAKIASNGGIAIITGEGADQVEIDTQFGANNINVETGEGDDRVSVKKSDDLYSGVPTGVMSIDLGDGASRLDVDLSVGKDFSTIETRANKEDGSRLHLTGKLNDDTDAVAENKRIEWASDAKDSIVLHPKNGDTLTIGVKDFASLTDALENKQTKNISTVTDGNYADFTNYSLDNAADSDNGKSWTRSGTVPSNLTLTNLVLGKGEDNIKVGDVDATGFNLLIKGKEIDLNGVLKAQNITVLAKDEHDISLHLDSDSIGGKIEDLFDWIGKNFNQNIVKNAIINVAGTARLHAENDIDLTAQLEQSGGLLESGLLSGIINPVNVKVGTAQVNIASGAELNAQGGSIAAEAKVVTDMTAGGGKLNLPVAVNVAVQNASVLVEKDAALKAAGNIGISAESKIEAKAEAPSQLASKSMPFAVSVAVLLNNVTADVKGQLTAGKDVTVNALGEIASDAVAKHEGDGLSGVYLGTGVTLQNVRALLDNSAAVQAGGDVNVKSTANMKATTVAKSGTEAEKEKTESEYAEEKADSGFSKTADMGLSMVKKYIGGFAGNLWGKIKHGVVSIFKNDPTDSEKMEKLLSSVAGGEHTVKLAEDSEQKGDVKFTESHVGTGTDVEITPWEGHQVDKVYYVYLDNPNGEDAATQYTVKEAGDGSDPDDNIYFIPMVNANVQVYVTYKDGEYAADDADTWMPEDLFNENDDDYGQDLQSLFDDATAGAQNSDDDDYGEDLQRLFDEDAAGDEEDAGDKLKFSIEPTETKDDDEKTVGAILNTVFNKTTGESVTTVDKNGKVTFIANARDGYKLKDDGLVISYYIEGEDKEQKAVLKNDGNGRYSFTVPEGILTDKYDDGIAFKVTSAFEKKDAESDNNVDQSQAQVNGSVAVTVAMNDNRAEIQSGASVTAGEAVNVLADEETRVNTNTDGTGTVKNAEKEEKEEKKQEKQQKLLSGQYIVTGKEVSLTLDNVTGGTVDVQQNGAYGYTFAPKQNGSAVTLGVTATLRYQKDGKWQTDTLTANSDGTYTVNLTSYAIDKGTQAVLGFAMPGSSAETQAKRDLVDYTMNVSYNVFQLSKEEDPYNVGNKKIGNVYFVKTTGEGENARYYFNIQPDQANGYTMDGAEDHLWASYTDVGGNEKKVALHQDSGSSWYVLAADLRDIAQGGNVTVNVRFTEDKHDIETGDAEHGSLTFSQNSAKTTDVITVKATPEQNYGAGKITVHYTNKYNPAIKETITLTPDENGEAKFTMPSLADGTSISVSAEFNAKTLTLQKDAQSQDVSINTAAKVSAGEKIAITLTDAAVQAGKKLNDTAEITYTPKEGQRKTVQVAVKDGRITLPEDIKDSTDVSIAVNAVEKAIALNGGEAKLDHGTLKIAASKADKGEKVVVTITPEAGYRFKQGSGTVEITTSTSSYKVKLTRRGDGSLTFTMPSSMTSAELQEAKANITLKGEFEKGNLDSSSFETSLGAAASVAVVNAKNSAVFSGSTPDNKAVNVQAVTVGESGTSASAGYSKAVTGLAGGFGVQVASFDTKALITKDAIINTNALTVSAKGTHGLNTTGSAAGAKEAGSTGVGSGIAVNVSSTDVAAAIQDEATVAVVSGKVKVAASSKTSDKVTAKAGAKGETGVTPVIGVDVFGSSATAYLGRVLGGDLYAKTVAINAQNTVSHDMTADASTGGGSVALGGAFGVTVIHDNAVARLNNSVTNDAADSAVTVSASVSTTQSVNTTAGVTGGVKGTAGKNGSAGSADKQVDSILGGAGNIAAKNSSSNSLSMKGSGSDERQKAQSSEGSVGGAAAVAVNVLFTQALARIMNGANINIGGAVKVQSVNRTETQVKANASTAKTDTGVGAAVAVNIVNIENTAEIGDGAVKAGSLVVSALMPEKADNEVDQMATVRMPESKDAMVAQLADYIKDGINDTLSEMGVDQSVIGELASTFAETFVAYVLKETGLDELLGDGTFDEKVDKVLGDLSDLWESVQDYPAELIKPLNTLKDQITALQGVDADNLKNILLGELKAQLPNLLKTTVVAVLNRAKDDIGSLAMEAINNKIKGKDQSSTKEKAKETLLNALKAEWTTLSNQLMNDALTRLRSEVPVLTQENIDTIKAAFTSSLDDKKDGFINYLTDTFQSKVFNYAAVMDKISNTDFASKAKEMMRGALNASVAKVGNAAIESLVDNLDVQLVPEDVSDKHVIRTEAISGAGAKDVGIAGSVAITILNANTTAVVNNGGALSITGEATVDAREARRVTTIASAALDQNGNADKNSDAGSKEEKDTVGGNAATPTVHLGEQLQVQSAVGAELQQDASDKNIVWITPRDGYKITAGADKAAWSYTDNGEEKTGKIQVYSKTVDGETKYYVKASDATTAKGKLTTVTITPEEDLHTISGLDAINLSEDDATKGKVPDGAVSVTVQGRDEAVKDGKLSAKVTDTVKISIDKTKLTGLQVDSIDYITADGKIHAVPLSATENGNESVFTFAMPAQNVTGILVEVDTAEENANVSKTAATDSKGRSVGVGASFSMVYGDSGVTAQINRGVTAGSLTVNAESDHAENTASVSGTDALTGELNIDAMKKTSVDASVALDILDNQVSASLNGAATTTQGDLALTAGENAVSDTRASGYAVGSQTAVGAAVAVNIASSAVNVQAEKDLTVAGSAKIDASSHSEDVTHALATAMGADIARAMNKVGEAAENLEDKSNDLLQGKLFDGKTDGGDNKDNKTADKINERLDKKQAEGGSESSKNLSLSSNALRNQNVTTNGEDAGSEGTDEALTQISENSGSKLNSTGSNTKSKVQVAAAVGVTAASHEAAVQVGKITAGKVISATAENTGNFNTLGTGAAMSLAQKANSIALGVAVSVNENKAKVSANGDLVSTDAGDVTLKSTLTQNMDGDFLGKLAAQSIAGSVAGKDSNISLGGAVSVVVSDAESAVTANSKTITGGDVIIEATDKSKLAARAGGVSLSQGSTVGMGIASTTIVSSNDVTAAVGDGATITADSFKLNAEKKAVTADDFKQLIDMRYLITDSSALNDEQRKEANTGLIDVHRGEGEDSYTVDVNLSTEKLLDAMDALNFLSGQNTYAEAIAGSVATGKTKANLAGSFAVAVTDNTVRATLGHNVTIKANNGNADVTAADGATTRVIAGSLSAAPAKASVGATVAVLVNGDSAETVTGDNAQITASGDITHSAQQTGDAQAFTAAMAVAAGANTTAAAGGAINVIVNKSAARNTIGNHASMNAGGDARIDSQAKYDLMLISGSANVTAGTGKVAAGGTVNVIVDKTQAATTLGDQNTITAGSNVSVSSDVSDQLISGSMSASVAATATGKSGAGAVNVIVSKSAADTALGSAVNITAEAGDLKLKANNDAWMLNATLAAALGTDMGIGGSFNVNVFDREADLSLADGNLAAGRDLYAQSGGNDTSILAGAALAGGITGGAFSGNVEVLTESSRVHTNISKGVTAIAGRNAILEANYGDFTVVGAGSMALSGAGSAVGVTSLTVVKDNDIRTQLAKSTVSAAGGSAVKTLSGDSADGVYVGANAKETQILGAAGVAVAGGSTVNGVVDVLVNNNSVIADAAQATLGKIDWNVGSVYVRYWKPGVTGTYWYGTHSMSRFLNTDIGSLRSGAYSKLQFRAADGSMYTVDLNNLEASLAPIKSIDTSNVTVKAKDDTKQILLAGGLNASTGVGVGASVVTLVSNKDVQALAKDINANGAVNVSAENQDDVTTVAVSASISNVSVQVGAAVQALRSRAIAEVNGAVIARNQGEKSGVNITSQNDTTLRNIAAAVGVGATAAVSPVAAVTVFEGESRAQLKEGGSISAVKDVNISATADKDVNIYSAGVAFGGTAGVSGAANVLVNKDKTQAMVDDGTSVNTDGSLDVSAQSDYTLRSASGVMAGGVAAGVGVNAVVSVLKSNTTAQLGGSSRVGGKVNVKASGDRDVLNMGAALAGGTAGVGVNVMVLVAGTKMSQDAADMLTYGNNKTKDDSKKTFDTQKFLSIKGVAAEYKEYERDENGNYKLDADGNRIRTSAATVTNASLSGDLAGNGHYDSQTQVDKDGSFDASSGYRSSDFDNENYNDDGDTQRDEKLEAKDTQNDDGDTQRGEKQEAADIQRGEKLEAKDTQDIAAAKQLNTVTYTSDPEDAVIARITESAAVTAKQVNVAASQQVAADLVGASAGVGVAGVGISTSVAILRSNVLATSLGAITGASQGVSVTATSESGSLKNDTTANKRDSDVKALLQDKLDVSGHGIRAIGVSAGGGVAGVAVGVAVALTDNITQATLGGSVTEAGDVTVSAKHDYGTVLAATGTASGGLAAVGASVSVAQANGTVKATVNRGTTVNASSVNVNTDATVDVDSAAAAAGAGGVAVQAGVAIANNRLTQTTGIEAETNVTASGDVRVTATNTSNANTYLLGASVGLAAVNMNAAVSDVAAKVNTFIGQADPKKEGETSATVPAAVISARDVILGNTVTAASTPQVLSVTGGLVAGTGNVLLAFNQTEAKAVAENADITATRNLDVSGNLSGSTVSSLTSDQVGGATVGLSVNYADMAAYNEAALNVSKVNVGGQLRVTTNGDGSSTTAKAETVAGQVGLGTAGFNVAIARNNTKNYATVISDRNMEITGETVIRAEGKSTAEADFTGLTVSVKNIAASTVVAYNDAVAGTTVTGNGIKAKGGLTVDAGQDAATTASATTGGGSLVSAKANVVLAYGRSGSVVDAAIAGGGEYAFLKSTNTAKDTVKAEIKNASIDLLTAAAMVGGAYSQDIFSSKVQLAGGDYTLGSADVLTDYTLKTTADVAPSSSGLDLSLGELAFNMAIAKNTAYAGSDLEFSIPKNSNEVKGDIRVRTLGTDEVEATVHTAKLSVSGLSMGANIAKADLSATQSAVMRVGGSLYVYGNLDVQSLARTATATAQIGANTVGDSGLSVSLASLDVSKAVANENLTNTAALLGAAYGTEKVEAMVDMGDYAVQTVTETDYDVVESVTYDFRNWWVKDNTITSNESAASIKIRMMKYYMDHSDEFRDVYRLGTTQTFMRRINNYQKQACSYISDVQSKLKDSTTTDPKAFEALDDNVLAQLCESLCEESSFYRPYVEEYMGSTDPATLMRMIYSLTDNEIQDYGWLFAASYFADGMYDLFEATETPNYGTKTVEETVWVPEYKPVTVEVDLYDASKNWLKLNSDNLNVNVFAGMEDAKNQTKAVASTNGAKGIGALSMGSLEARATASDAVSAMIEGMEVSNYQNLNLSSAANTAAYATGFKSGGVDLVSVDHSTVKAMVGKPNDNQSATVVVGENVRLTGSFSGATTITAKNTGYAEANMDQSDTAWSAGSFKTSTQKTESWYSTLISIGENARIYYGNITVQSEDSADAKSAVDSSSVGILMNFNTLQGKNTIHQENNIDFGKNVYLKGDGYKTGITGNVVVEALQNTQAYAETLSSGGGLIAGDTATARNTIDRVVRVNMGPNSDISAQGTVTLRARSGVGDDIYTHASVSSAGLVDIGNAKAYADVTSNAEIIVGNGADLRGDTGTALEAIATSYKSRGKTSNEPGITTIGHVDALGLVAVPNGVAHNTLTFNTYIGINQDANDSRSYINYHNGAPITILATNAGLTAKADALAKGKGGFGVSNATAWNEVYLQNAVWIDNATLSSGNNGKTITIRANNGDTGADRLHLIANAHAALSGLAGKVAPTSRISGTQVNQIRSNDPSKVRFYTNDKVEHIASNPINTIWTDQKATYDRWEVKIWFVTLTLTKASVVKDLNWNYFDRCDFCGTGKAVDVRPTAQDPLRDRYEAAYKAAMDAIAKIRQMAGTLPANISAQQAYLLAKGLVPLTYLDTLVSGRTVVVKSRYSEEENKAASEIFAMDVRSILDKDVRLTADQLGRYQLWQNARTQHQVYMLPNAARLYTAVWDRLDYVTDILYGDVLGDGRAHHIEVITALNDRAFANPVLPIGSTGSLDFTTGTLYLPSFADMELYLHEISAKWLLENMENGIFRTLMADPDALNACADGGKLPNGQIVEGFIPGEVRDGWQFYWIGATPETAADPDQPLICLLVNPETDEVDAFRTSLNLMETDTPAVDVSLSMYRDAKSDRQEIEKYNMFFFDTRSSEPSLVKVVTTVLENRSLEMPRPMRIILRAFRLAGADMPVYSISDDLFVMNDGTDGEVSLFDGFYTATFDGDTFDSDYTRVEGIEKGELNVTIKQDQPVWPEWTGENEAETQDGRRFVLEDGEWRLDEDLAA